MESNLWYWQTFKAEENELERAWRPSGNHCSCSRDSVGLVQGVIMGDGKKWEDLNTQEVWFGDWMCGMMKKCRIYVGSKLEQEGHFMMPFPEIIKENRPI